MNEIRCREQNTAAKSVLPLNDEIPTQMSPFSNDRWDLDHQENIRRKEIQRSYVYNRQCFQQPHPAPEESIPTNPSQEHETRPTLNQESEDNPQDALDFLPDISNKDYFKLEAPQVLKPKSIRDIKFETPAPPDLFPVLKFPEKRIKTDTVYHLPTKEIFLPRPNNLPPEQPLPIEHPPKPQFSVFKDYQPEKPKPMHYGVHVPLWQFSSNKRDIMKKNKMGRSLELKINDKNSKASGASTKGDVSKPVSTQPSHEDIAKVLKTLGGISKSLGYKIPKEDSVKNYKGKKKNIKMVEMKAPNLREFVAKQPTPANNLQSRTSLIDSSQATLTQKMAEVFGSVTSKKPLSELNLLKIGTNLAPFKNGNVSMPNFPFVGSTNTFPPITFKAHENNRVPTYLESNKSSIGEKSRSSEYFKHFNLTKTPSKSLSFDNDQSIKAERQDSKAKEYHSISRNTSETFIRKVNLTKSQDSSHFIASPPFKSSFESIDWGKLGFREPHSTKQLHVDTSSVFSYPRDSIQSRICPHRSQSGSAKLNLNIGTPSCFSSLLPTIGNNNKFCSCDGKKQNHESSNIRSKHLLRSVDPAENDNKELPKTSVRVCHCPHLHTENTIKKICFHNCLSPQNFNSSKIFRVNYLPKDERHKEKKISESDIKQDKESVIEDSKTITSEAIGKRENSIKSVKKVFSSDLVSRDLNKSTLSFKTSERNKTISKTSLRKESFKARKSLSNSKMEKKEKLKKIRTFSEYTRPNVILWNKENHVQILGQSRDVHMKKGTSDKISSEDSRKHTVDSKPTKVAPQVKKNIRGLIRPLSRLRSRESKKVSNDEKALEELAVLEKLFAKLNTVERSLRKQKLAASHQCRSISKMALKKDKGQEEPRLSFNQMKSFLMLNSPTEEEYQRRRKKLRSAIIRHVQNWLKLDFDEF